MDIEAIKRRLLVKYAPFGSILANTSFVVDPSIDTAATNGKNIYYNNNFIEKLSQDEQVFVFAHELCHIAFDHVYRSEGKDLNIWNIATDAVINAMLKKDKLSIVDGAVDIADAINYDAEQLYQKLLQEKQESQNQKDSSSKGNEGSTGQNGVSKEGSNRNDSSQTSNSSDAEQNHNGHIADEEQNIGHDSHSMWKKAVEEKNQSKSEENQSEQKLRDEIRTFAQLGEKQVFKQIKIERKKQLEELLNAIAQESHGYGNRSNGDIRNITDIGVSDPLIDWRMLLKEAIKYDIDWSYQNASIENGVVTANLEEIPRPETEIMLDTSGSINEILLRNFLRECKHILQMSKVKVGCFDTNFYGFTEINKVEDIDVLSFRGGGGTNFEVAVNAFTKRVENKIIFTDGEARMPSTAIDAIWVVFGSKKITPVGGRVIYIDEEQLNRLCNLEMTNESGHKIR